MCTPPRLRTQPEEIIADFRLANFVESDHILFGTDFPAVSPQSAGWYTNNVDAYFRERPDLLDQVMHDNAQKLLRRLAATSAN